MLRTRHIFAALFLLCAPIQLTADELPDFDFRNWTTDEELNTYRSDLYSVHQACNSAATQRQLSGDEAIWCGEVFLELKLSFLNGVTRERYNSMPANTRAKAHDMSYAAYRAWVHRQISMAEGPETLVD